MKVMEDGHESGEIVSVGLTIRGGGAFNLLVS